MPPNMREKKTNKMKAKNRRTNKPDKKLRFPKLKSCIMKETTIPLDVFLGSAGTFAIGMNAE